MQYNTTLLSAQSGELSLASHGLLCNGAIDFLPKRSTEERPGLGYMGPFSSKELFQSQSLSCLRNHVKMCRIGTVRLLVFIFWGFFFWLPASTPKGSRITSRATSYANPPSCLLTNSNILLPNPHFLGSVCRSRSPFVC